MQAVLVALVALAVGIAIGAASSSAAHTRQLTAEKIARQAKADAAKARADATKAQANATTTQQQAATADARAKAAAAADLKVAQDAVSAREAAVAKREKAVGIAEATAAANTFAGDGTYLVGSDVMPGTYKAAAMQGCYWARLKSLDTSDIIDNNNADGPVVLQILRTDKAIEVSGCAEFHKVG